ncbi:MAG: PilT protein domain protein [Dehalococcoidia bacterium]|nr:PilT protein domain protein [Dehalococcoidia bacterium]
MVNPLLPLRERRVFVDSSAYLALLDEEDENHDQAIQIVTQLANQRFRLYVTNILLIEAHALIMSNLGIAAGIQFLNDMDESKTIKIRVRASDEQRAKQIIFQYDDKDFSLTDAISFTVMERLGITYVFTFDRHFAQYGLNVLTPSAR